MNITIRPTNMAAAFVAAAMSSPSSLRQVVRDNDRPTLKEIIVNRALSDDMKAPLKSGYNRAEHDGIRVSNATLARVNRRHA